jgi:hypothetical protein
MSEHFMKAKSFVHCSQIIALHAANVIFKNAVCGSIIMCHGLLTNSKTTIDHACAAVIVTGGSYAIIEGCFIKSSARIGK